MTEALKPRDYLFDNYKVFLIFLVVVGHFIGPSANDNEFLYLLKWVIVSFHMPAFIFISGYFSKKNIPFTVSFTKLAVPYLAFELIYYVLYTAIGKSTELALLEPKFTLWYLLALFLWRIVTPYVKKISGYMIFAILAGMLIGFSDMKDNFLTIPRALVFYPFYLAGTNFQRETLTKWRSDKGKLIAAFAVLTVILGLCYIGHEKLTTMLIFYGRYNYDSMHKTLFNGVLWRILMYIIGFIMTLCLMVLMPEKKLPISYIGTRTMAIYLFHGLTFKTLEHCTTLLENLNSPSETFLLLLGCAVLTLLFSWMPFTKFTNIFVK